MDFEPRIEIVTIYTGDYLSRIRHLEAQAKALKEAEDGTARMLHEVPEYLAVAQEHDELVAEAEEKALHVKLQQLDRISWKALVKEHPPRVAGDGVTEKEAAADFELGVNEETFREPLVRASIIDPQEAVDNLDNISHIDFERLYIVSFGMNRAVAIGPKASLVSRLTQTNSETSA